MNGPELKKGFAEARGKAGISDLHRRGLRHTFGTDRAKRVAAEAARRAP